MHFSKSQRIIILLVVNFIFLLVEIITGYMVHSLALVADAFHMLNDVLSLLVGLWAVKVAGLKKSSKTFTYGWQRAETLGALVNGVFLIALCVTIFLDAIQRFFEPQEVSNPQLVLIVGSLGLAFNVLGMFLFHDHSHGHSHGPPGEGDALKHAEEGVADSHQHDESDAHMSGANGNGATVLPQGENVRRPGAQSEGSEGNAAQHAPSKATAAHRERNADDDALVADESGNVADVLPQNRVGWSNSLTGRGEDPSQVATPKRKLKESRNDATAEEIRHRQSKGDPPSEARRDKQSRGDSTSEERRHWRRKSRAYSIEDIYIRPSDFRDSIIKASRMGDVNADDSTDSAREDESAVEDDQDCFYERDEEDEQPLINGSTPHVGYGSTFADHSKHQHAQPQQRGKGHGHSHGDLNMRGIFLHVMGDALGNIGVIATALVIWFCKGQWRFYFDPAISLVITVIILCSAIPLCRAASRILLQAVPAGINIDHIKEDISFLPGIVSCHHVHVWQLSDSKIVASLHVQVSFDFKGDGSARYMHLAREIRECLHSYGIHSSTIQPEFCLDPEHDHKEFDHESDHSHDHENTNSPSSSTRHLRQPRSGKGSKTASVCGADACLLECGDECGEAGNACCAPAPQDDHVGHDHAH